MHDHIAVIHDHPAVAGESLYLSLLSMGGVDAFIRGIGERIEHTVAGACAKDEIIGKGYDVFQFDQDDVFSLFVFQGIHDFTGKFESVQGSPHGLDNWAENSLVYTDPPGCRSLLNRWTESIRAVPMLPS